MMHYRIILLSLLLFFGCSKPGKMGNPESVNLITNTGSSAEAIINVANVTVMPSKDIVLVIVLFEYENTSKNAISWMFDETAVTDAKDRIYRGAGKFDVREMSQYELAMTFNSWFMRIATTGVMPLSILRDRKVYLIEECGPGMKKQNFVVFELPKSAFEENLYFGFLNKNGTDTRGKILIFDKSKSTYDFSKSGSFDNAGWTLTQSN